MKKPLSTALVLFCTLSSLAQNPESFKLDSLITWLDSNINTFQDSTSVKQNIHKAIQLSKRTKNQNSLAKSYAFSATYHKYYSKLDSAFYYNEKVKEIYSIKKNDLEFANSLLFYKDLLMEKGDNAEATKAVFQALEIFEKINDKKGIALAYTSIGYLKYFEKKYTEGIEWCDKAIIILQKLGDKEALANTYRIKATDQLFSSENYEDALVTINKSIDLYRELGETGMPLMSSINWRGNIYKYMGKYDDAIADYQSNYDEASKLGLERYYIASNANIGHTYLMQGKYKEALPYNLKAIDLMKKTGRIMNLWENYQHVSDTYEALGEFKLALYYHQLYSKAFEEYEDNKIDLLESEAQTKYETGQKNATIYFQDEKIAQQKRTQTLYILLASLLAFILILSFIYYRKRQKRIQQLHVLNEKLKIKNEQNELLMKEIHHRVKNNLELVKSLLALQSAQLEDSASKEAMLSSQNRVQSMGIIHQKLYQGENLGSVDMKDYFINLGEGILDTFNAEDKVKIECAMEKLELDVDTAVPIGLIVNELLTNALKYAFPNDSKGKIQISLSQSTPQTLTLKVADNGVGKTLGNITKGTGFGTQLIQLLTQQLDGKMFEDYENGTSILFQFKTKPAA